MSATFVANRIDAWVLSAEGQRSLKASAWMALVGYVLDFVFNHLPSRSEFLGDLPDLLAWFSSSVAFGLTVTTWWYWVRIDRGHRKDKRSWFWGFVIFPLISAFAYVLWKYHPREEEMAPPETAPFSLWDLSFTLLSEISVWLVGVALIVAEVFGDRIQEMFKNGDTWLFWLFFAYGLICEIYVLSRMYSAGMKKARPDPRSSLGLI